MMLLDHDVQLSFQEIHFTLGQVSLDHFQPLLVLSLFTPLVIDLSLPAPELLLLSSDFQDLLPDLDLPVFLQGIKVVVKHLVRLGLGDIVQATKDFGETGSLMGVILQTI